MLVDAEKPGSFPHAKLLSGMPGLAFVDLDGEQILLLAGLLPLDPMRVTLEAARLRTPEPEPAEEYTGLVRQRDALRVALAGGDEKSAVAALRAILMSGKGLELQREAGAANIDLTARGLRRIDAAGGLTDRGRAQAALLAVVTDYAGHPVAQRAAGAIATLRAAAEKQEHPPSARVEDGRTVRGIRAPARRAEACRSQLRIEPEHRPFPRAGC